MQDDQSGAARKLNEQIAFYYTGDSTHDNAFAARFTDALPAIFELYLALYRNHKCMAEMLPKLIDTIGIAYKNRPEIFREKDIKKPDHWFLSNKITGMSLYVDRFANDINGLADKLDYFKKLGVNFLHLMPIFQSPSTESDGGYAVSDFRKIDQRFGSLGDFKNLREKMDVEGMYLMTDIVLNHTSRQHEWAKRAAAGEQQYQDYYYMYDDRVVPDLFDGAMPDIFPESAPGNFTWVEECRKWVMTVFHQYQWDLNFANPQVFVSMVDNVLFYANLGVDILRIDAPAFIWKQAGTTSQNLDQAHTILRLLKQCVQVASPGMALLGEAIVASAAIMKYFGTDSYVAKECDFAYNATQMALQWDALATSDTCIMLTAQEPLLRKPVGTSWITYTRSHDDIGLGYDDETISKAGFDPYAHRRYLKEYYSGAHYGSPATGALFSVNPKTQDARISGSLASLCGLELAIKQNDQEAIDLSIKKILLMQAQSFFIGGIPMIFYGDESGYTNDYNYLDDPGKNYDNRWMHRPRIDWHKNAGIDLDGTIEQRIFCSMQNMIAIRNKLSVLADHSNITWMNPHNIHVAGFLRTDAQAKLFCVFNYEAKEAFLTWYAFKEYGFVPTRLFDHMAKQFHDVGKDEEYIIVPPYGFYLLEVTGIA